MSDIVEKCQCWLCANEKAAQAAEIERLRAALRVIRGLPNLQTHYGSQITDLIDAALEERT